MRERGLSDTTPYMGTLQANLMEQFQLLPENERTKAFIGQEEMEDIKSNDSDVKGPYEKIQSPVLSFISYEPQQTAVALQKWEGMVIAINGDSFVARLNNLTENTPEEEIEMNFRDISDDDQNLVHLGAIFYWSIGYEKTAAGQRKRTSVIKFRRLPAWTDKELAAIKKKAADARRAIGWGKQDAASQAG